MMLLDIACRWPAIDSQPPLSQRCRDVSYSVNRFHLLINVKDCFPYVEVQKLGRRRLRVRCISGDTNSSGRLYHISSVVLTKQIILNDLFGQKDSGTVIGNSQTEVDQRLGGMRLHCRRLALEAPIKCHVLPRPQAQNLPLFQRLNTIPLGSASGELAATDISSTRLPQPAGLATSGPDKRGIFGEKT